MQYNLPQIDRRGLLGLAAASLAIAPWAHARAEATSGASPQAPVTQLNDALIAAMKAGNGESFDARYRMLAPVVDQVFDLNAVLAASIGLSWASLPEAQKAQLTAAFRRYTVSTYVANFNSYDGQSFQVLPSTRNVAPNEVVVETKLERANGSPVRLDYVMRNGPSGWQVVDVLTDGSISRVAVQRSDFRELLKRGGAPALAAHLGTKVDELSGSVSG